MLFAKQTLTPLADSAFIKSWKSFCASGVVFSLHILITQVNFVTFLKYSEILVSAC
jgi:hypothetical protein